MYELPLYSLSLSFWNLERISVFPVGHIVVTWNRLLDSKYWISLARECLLPSTSILLSIVNLFSSLNLCRIKRNKKSIQRDSIRILSEF